MYSLSFSDYVKNRAESMGLSVTELARQTGISRQALYNLMDGSTTQARVSTIVALAHTLKVHPVVLFRHLLNHFEFPKFSTTGAKHQFDASGFVAETLPDNSIVATGQTFCKTWEIQNIGHITWKNRKLICVDNRNNEASIVDGIAPPSTNRNLQPSEYSIKIPETLPGDSVLLSVEFTAPAYPCTVFSYWKMTDEHGDICFPETEGLSCLVQVISI